MSTKSLRPVVALDVDGVLNIDNVRDGLTTVSLTLKKDTWPDTFFLRGLKADEEVHEVIFDPACGTWILQLQAAGVEVVWATTWEEAANMYWAPLLGIPELALGASRVTNPPRFGDARHGDSVAWKRMALAENFGDRPLVFVDDNLIWPMSDERWSEERGSFTVPTLSIIPNSRVGLVQRDMDKVNAWLADLGWPVN